MRIRFKLTLQFTLLVSLIVLLSFLGIYYFTHTYIENRFYSRLRSKAITTAELLVKVDQIDSKLLKVIEKTNKDVLYKEKISIYNYKNEEIYTNNDTVKVVVTRKFLNDVRLEGTATTTYQDIQILGIPYYDKYNRLLVLAGGVDQQGLETLRDLQRILISLYIIIVFTSAIFGWIFAGRALLPIAEVINEMNDIYPNNLKKRLKVRNVKDEIGQLTFTFNNLLTRVEEAFQHQQVFISNVSHELKNPLTKIISQLTVSLLNRRTEEEYQETMESVLQDVKDLNLLTNTLLELTKLSDDSLPNRFTSIRIDDIIWEARSSLLKVHKNYGISIEFSYNIDSDEQLSILGNSQLLKVAFMNLIENGCKFSTNQTINVNIGFDKGLFLEFINKGAVIDTKDQKLIFLPFFRSKKTADTRGYGIGLPLAERIIKLHKGNLFIKESTLDKTVFKVQFFEEKVIVVN